MTPGPAAQEHRLGQRRDAKLLVNITANFTGQAIASLVGLLCVPIYLRLLGAEALGLIGFSLALQAILRVLDAGVSPAVVRQMARLGGQPGRSAELADFFCTFERLFIGAAILVAVVMLSLSQMLATHWLRAEHLPEGQVVAAVAFIGVQCSVYFIGALYQSVLVGLERQLLFNSIKVAETCASHVGAVLLLSFWAPRAGVLFGWQMAVSVVAVLIYGLAARLVLPTSLRGRFQYDQVRRVLAFAMGMAGITATGTVLANMDKLMLSRWLKLENFGHYMLAFYAANLMSGLLVAPVFNALFPRYCALAEGGDEAAQLRLHHLALQALVTLVWPVAAILWVFAADVLQLWISDKEAVAAAGAIVPIITAGVALNTLMVPAYMLQLSRAWTTLGFKLNLALIAIFGPLLYVLTIRWGLVGAAANYALMQGAYLMLGMPLTHRRFLRGAAWEFVLRDMLPGVVLCMVAAAGLGAAREDFETAGPLLRYLAVLASWACLVAATVLVSGRMRLGLLRTVVAGAPQAR